MKITLWLVLVLILAFSFFSNSKNIYKCIHDEISKNFVPKPEPLTGERLLLEGIEDVKSPLRVTFDMWRYERISEMNLNKNFPFNF